MNFDSAFRYDIPPWTGGVQSISTSVRQSISQLTKNSNSRFWIGIASNGDDGCRARWNSKYKALGMKNMAAVYKTGSRKSMEQDLIYFYSEHVSNKGSGGEGGAGIPPYQLYVVWK